MKEHETEVNSGYGTGTVELWFAWCSCGWHTHPVDLKTEAEAEEAARAHRYVQDRLNMPANAVIAGVYRKHALRAKVGLVECTCGEWQMKGYPVGAETATSSWLLHFCREVRKAQSEA